VVGSHGYSITTTDTVGGSSSYSGSFNVVAAALPSIGMVVVAEATGARNGVFTTNEPLVITWAATSSIGVASQTLTVDAQPVAPIHGPYGGLYYSCLIGKRAAGNHAFSITTTDTTGGRSIYTGTFNVTSAAAAASRADILAAVMCEISRTRDHTETPLDGLNASALSSGTRW
jgi:hypothetical protein